MAKVEHTFSIRKRWLFWPAMITIIVLGKLRVIRDAESAAKWLADHAMRLEVVE
jgi:hypothetical protein